MDKILIPKGTIIFEEFVGDKGGKVLKNVQNAINHLLLIINKYQIEDCRPQVETLKQLRESLDNDEIQDIREKWNIYKSLFPPHGGLSDLHYWHDDFQIRKEVNDDISTLKKIIADYLLEGLK